MNEELLCYPIIKYPEFKEKFTGNLNQYFNLPLKPEKPVKDFGLFDYLFILIPISIFGYLIVAITAPNDEVVTFVLWAVGILFLVLLFMYFVKLNNFILVTKTYKENFHLYLEKYEEQANTIFSNLSIHEIYQQENVKVSNIDSKKINSYKINKEGRSENELFSFLKKCEPDNFHKNLILETCLLYTSDAADE